MNFTFRKKHTPAAQRTSFSIASRILKDPHVDWVMIILIGFLCCVAGMAVAASLFLGIRGGVTSRSSAAVNAASDQILNPASLGKLVDSFGAHQAAFETIRKNSYTTTKDPSQ